MKNPENGGTPPILNKVIKNISLSLNEVLIMSFSRAALFKCNKNTINKKRDV